MPASQVHPPPLDASKPEAPSPLAQADPWEADLWRRWRLGHDGAAREQLIHHYLPYAKIIAASSYARRTHHEIEFAEYLQWASVGLIEATDRFDPEYGAQFKTFASKRMQGAILNGLERMTEKNQQIAVHKRLNQERLESAKAVAQEEMDAAATASNVPSAGRSPEDLFRYLAEVGMGLALGVLLDGTCMVDTQALATHPSAISPEVSYFRQAELRHLQQLLRGLVDRLAAQEQTVIRYHYLQEVCFEEIAALLGVSRSRVSQIHRQALKSLRKHLPQRASCDVMW